MKSLCDFVRGQTEGRLYAAGWRRVWPWLSRDGVWIDPRDPSQELSLDEALEVQARRARQEGRDD